jgi:RNA-directed DNA polymerase
LGWAFFLLPPATMPRTLAGLTTLDDVAVFLDVSANFLRFVLYGRRDREHYTRFHIPKRSGGFREISVPPASLKVMQRKIATALLQLYPVKPSVHGFVWERSVVSNAKRHEMQRVVGNLDLRDFFPRIHLGRVRHALQRPPYSLGSIASLVVAQICCDHMGILPQGAPSSPIISNIICRGLDEQLQQLARRHGCRYTRYADDITISTSRPLLPTDLLHVDPFSHKGVVGANLNLIITSAGFDVHPDKVRIAWTERKQEVTGLTTNERVNVGRWFVREMNTLLYIWHKHGAIAAASSYARRHGIRPERASTAHLLNFLRGKFSYLRMVKGDNDPVCRRIHWDLTDLAGSAVKRPVDLIHLQSAPLRGQTGRFRGWQAVTTRYHNSVKFVEIKVGSDLRTGSAFVVDSNVAVTAGHNVSAGPLRLYDGATPLYPSRIYSVNTPGSLDFAVLVFEGHPFVGVPPFHFEYRLPELGEDVAAMGFPAVAFRYPTIVLHSGAVEALPISYSGTRFIQTSFQSGGGLSGGPLIDQRGRLLGVMVENVFMDVSVETLDGGRRPAPPRPYGQAVPFEYIARTRTVLRSGGESSIDTPSLEMLSEPDGEKHFT